MATFGVGAGLGFHTAHSVFGPAPHHVRRCGTESYGQRTFFPIRLTTVRAFIQSRLMGCGRTVGSPVLTSFNACMLPVRCRPLHWLPVAGISARRDSIPSRNFCAFPVAHDQAARDLHFKRSLTQSRRWSRTLTAPNSSTDKRRRWPPECVPPGAVRLSMTSIPSA
jgi:hypothetical protein